MHRPLPIIFFLLATISCQHTRHTERNEHKPLRAGEALRMWAMARSFPDGQFHTDLYEQAARQMRLEAQLRGERNNTWEPLGPRNIGGRTLCLAIHPQDSSVLFAGSASGGLWKSHTAGEGPDAWERIETGFPVLGISAIAIDPVQPDHMYLGTGEVYNYENSMPNVAFRTTRGSYGIGILKSTDGGQSWTKSLDWAYNDLRGVQDLKINPLNPATIYAATSEGLLRSYNAGASWSTINDVPMAADLEINPLDTNLLYVTHGSLDDNSYSAAYRSTDGGNTFTLMNNGLPTGYSGKTMLGLCASQPQILYASVGNAFNQNGLYKSTDSGASWLLVNTEDVCKYQGWYSHDVSVHPDDPDQVVWTGIDTWKSYDGGYTFNIKSYWYNWYFGIVPAGGPEGPDDYVHADIHRAYYLPGDKVYLVTDGGVFVSYDGAETFAGRNGGYQTQQFYANLGNSASNPAFCIGGMQDNSTAIFLGDGNWKRVLGGDGECAAINQENDQMLYGSSQYLSMYRSINGGNNFSYITPEEAEGEDAAFNGPFELAPSNQQVLYCGAESIFRSNDGGSTWTNVSGGPAANGDFVLTIAVNPLNTNDIYFSTAPSATNQARVFRLNASSGNAFPISGLPNRLCMDIAYHPLQTNTVYAVFAGFGAEHVWRTQNGGGDWEPINNGLPDVPTNTILVDPLYPSNIYVGNDLGVWLSTDGGDNWALYSSDAPSAFMVMHLSVSPADRMLRAATYGLGVWQTPLAEPVSANEPLAQVQQLKLAPNPAVDQIELGFHLDAEAETAIQIADASGKTVLRLPHKRYAAGAHTVRLNTEQLPAGIYAAQIIVHFLPERQKRNGVRTFVVVR